MKLQFQNLAALAAILVTPFSTFTGAEALDISSDTPITSLIASAKAARAQGNNVEALNYFDAAVKRDLSDYLNIFQRGATYLSLGRNAQAKADFDNVLKIKPGFEGALLQRAKIHARNAEWDLARTDYTTLGSKGQQELAGLDEAQKAAIAAIDAETHKDWENCVNQAGVAIMTAGTALSLRQLRARCRFARGEIHEGVSDLGHILQIHPGNLEPHVQMSSMLFYSLGDTERGLTQIRKCLQSDPDLKACKSLFREEKAISKAVEKVAALMSKRQFNSAVKLLLGSEQEDEPGLLAEIKTNVESLRAQGAIHEKAGSELYARHVEKVCECYVSMNNHKKASTYCVESLELDPTSLYGLLHLAQTQTDAENYEAAIGTLNTAKDNHPESQEIKEKLREAQMLLKRSKTKDYYKVLGVPRDADERQIEKAYRSATREFHPDKAMARGISKEDAEKKMAAINEAYEVLGDSELKARFDRGDDPNDPMAQQGGNPFHGSPFGPGGGQQFVFRQGGGPQFMFSGGNNPFGQGFPFGGM